MSILVKLIIVLVIGIGITVTTIVTHNKINKTYICDSILDCQSRDTVPFKVYVHQSGKRVLKPVKKLNK